MRWNMIPLVLLLVVPQALLAQTAYSTLDDATWGNENLSFRGTPIPVLLDSLVAGEPLLLGLPGRSVAFEDGAEPCIIVGLPASGRPDALPEIGDAVVDSTCVLPDDFPANKRGKFRNPLLGETIALSLNVRMDAGLGDVHVEPIMETVQALPGEDGIWGTDDDTLCATCDTMTIKIPGSVLAAVGDSMGLDPTINGVLAFANSCLGGEAYGVRYRDTWHAVKNLNRGFRRSRFLLESAPIDTMVPIFLTEPPARTADADAVRSVTMWAASSAGRSVVHLELPEPADVRVSAYNVAGRRVAVLADEICGAGELTLDFPAGGSLPSGVYFVRASVVSEATGEAAVRTSKVLLVR
jgi:hypothetical protein